MKKLKKNITCIFLLLCMLINYILPITNTVLAKSISESERVNLVKDHMCHSLLKIKGEDNLKLVAYVCYNDPDTGRRYPAFCVEPSKEGIGTGAGDSYDVDLSSLDNPILWRMLYKGYCGSSYQDWGLEKDDDLYYATKVAVHCFVDGSTPYGKYDEPHRVGHGQNVSYEEVLRRGRKVLSVAQQIYDFGMNGTDNYIQATVNITTGNQTKETISGIRYLVQNYTATANKELSSYKVSILGFPQGTKILDNANNEKTDMTNSNFKIAIPMSEITSNINGYINVTDARVKTFPIFYANSGNNNTQNYIINDPSEVTTARATFTVNAFQSTLKIIKKDAETNKPVKDVIFNVRYSDGTLVGDYKTNSAGKINISNLRQGTIIATEISAPDNYIVDSIPHSVIVEFNSSNTLNVPNNHKKGNLVIKKVDADCNEIPLEDVTFKVYDCNKHCISTIKTDKDGIARINNINVGNYTIEEVSTNQYYRLNPDIHNIEVKWYEEFGDTNITITNEKKTGYIEINKYDKEAQEKYNTFLGVSGVLFGIYDEQGGLVDEITTNANGYCKSHELPLDQHYIVKELLTRDEYITNNTEFKVNLTENGIIDGYVYTLNVANEHKKGNLFVEKITLDDKTIQLGHVEFELYLVGRGELKLYMGTYFTDANGEIYIEDLNTGNYMLKEVSTNRWYYLHDDTPIEVKWYDEFGNTNVTIENEKKKGIIQVIKTDSDFIDYPLENVKFNVYDEDNNFIETITTNSEGIAESTRLRIDKKYYVVECKTLQNYILDNTIHTIDFTEGLTKDQINDIQTDTIKTLKLQNQHEKGNLVISKVDALDNTKFLKDITFELYAKNLDKPYEQNQLIGTYKTDENGKIEINDLWTGEYLLKEVETDIWHKLNIDNTDVVIKYNETTTLTIENEPKQGYITIDKQDSEFSDVKIPNVTFNIYDEDANYIESITTDESGFAKSSLLPIDKTYYVVEVATNDKYILNNEAFKVNFVEDKTEEQIAEIRSDIEFNLVVKNEKIKGKLQITKVDSTDNTKTLQGAVFGIYDCNNNLVQEIVTDENRNCFK